MRFVYWVLAMIEMALLLGALILFVVSDARTVKALADNFLPSTEFTYDQIEGNFFTGLEIRNLAYKDKSLFDRAVVYWNPLTLIQKKISLTQVDIEGVEIESIVKMVYDLKSPSTDNNTPFDFSYSFDNIHVDINPYVYEGVKFSSFLFETEKIEVDKALNIDSKGLYLYFDSDLVNVELLGTIDKSKLLLDKVNLKEIRSREIGKFIGILRTKSTTTKQVVSKKTKEPFFKEIKIKEILATLKSVNYEPLKIKNAEVFIKNASFDSYNNYRYKAKDLKFTGQTNFGNLDYKGDIRNSMIVAKGALTLDKELFTRYKLPLNYENLRKLPSTLKLNAQGVWLDIEHTSKELLKIKSTFNLDVSKGEHKLYYDYSDRLLSVESLLNINMPYGDQVRLENKTLVNKIGHTTYAGKIAFSKVKNLPKEVSEYLLEGLNAKFKGDSVNLDVDIDSKLLKGTFVTHGYQNALLKLESKANNIALKRVVSGITEPFKNEMLGLRSEGFFDFKNGQNSTIDLHIDSAMMAVDASMKPYAPYKILLNASLPSNSSLLQLDNKINVHQIGELSGSVALDMEHSIYQIVLQNENDLMLIMHYNALAQSIEEGLLTLGGESLHFRQEHAQAFYLDTKIENLQTFLNHIKKYYKLELPTIKGKLNLAMIQHPNGLTEFELETPQLKYVDANASVLNFNKIETQFSMDKAGKIEIKNYKFSLDENGYLKDFYSKRSSYLRLKDEKVIIKKLWIRDQVRLEGEYHLALSKGDFKLFSKKFSLKNKDFDLLLRLGLDLKIRGKLINIEGDIGILGNQINYDMEGSSIAEDADIIIVQEMLKKKESALQNLKLYLKIASEKPLKYLAKNTHIEFFNELRVLKNYKTDLQVTGMSTITKGHYQMEDKRFTLNESHLYFAGNPRKPLLDIKANYEKDQYTVHIFISGSAEEPIVNFNSDPYLTQQEILSLILFDGTGSSNGQGAEAYTLLGGTFAKGLIKSLGINVDHLLLGTDENDEFSLEIGRKISDDITIMYMHEDGKDGAKVRLEHNKDFETDIIIMPPSTSSIEFLYKQDR